MTPRFAEIKDFYQARTKNILAAGKNRYGIDPYAWNDLVTLSPIEWRIWQDIRELGLVMYPQYPVAGFFVDFGNPIAKVAIECDGKEFHQDVEADRRRQAIIESHGWTVYRFTGRQCNEPQPDPEDEFKGQAFRILEAIGDFHQLTPRTVSMGNTLLAAERLGPSLYRRFAAEAHHAR
jgi:hypothetical protein